MFRRALQLAVVMLLAACGDDGDGAEVPADPDMRDYTCTADPIIPVCESPVTIETAELGAGHIPVGEPIVYPFEPPSSGDHRSAWGRWGEYEFLPPQRWLHNLEHGGIALLYHPCAPAEVVDALRAYARARADDASGPFRWVLTPYPDLSSTIAVVAWEWTFHADCVDTTQIETFVGEHYRQAPEDVAGDGSFQELWLGR